MGDDHGAAGAVGDEALEAVEPVEVEVVRRLVEQQHAEARQQDRGERGARGLAAGERGGLLREQRRVEAELAAHRLGARLEVGAAEPEPLLERVRVGRVGAVRALGHPGRGRLHARVGRGHAGAACEVGLERLAGRAVGLLRQVAGGPGGERHRAAVGRVDAREDAQERRLAGAVGADDAEHVAGATVTETPPSTVSSPWALTISRAISVPVSTPPSLDAA